MLGNNIIQLPDYVHAKVVENELFIFVDKTSETFCFNDDVLWLIETLTTHNKNITFSTLVKHAQHTFSSETLPDIKTFLISQVKQLVKLRILLIMD